MERWLIWLAEVLAPPVLAGLVSVAYFRASRSQPPGRRILVSSHGASIVVVYALSWLALLSGKSGPILLWPFAALLVIPVVLITASFVLYRGPKKVHWLQVPNIVCLLWTGLVGAMMVTGRSP